MPRTKRSRPDRLASFLHPTTRFVWGLVLLASLVFAQGWPVRGLLMTLGLILALGSGKRVSLVYFSFLVATVVLFHLLLPIGRVWWTWGPLTVTEGAFYLGLGKGFTFAGLVFISLSSVSRDLKLPGRFGNLWGQTFSWYEQLMDQRHALKPRALLLSVDRLLEQLYPTRGKAEARPLAQPSTVPPKSTTAGGWVLIVSTAASAVALSVWLR